MNSHNPFNTGGVGCTNDFRSADQLVDRIIGDAYNVVKAVYLSLGKLEAIYTYLNKYGLIVPVDSETELKDLDVSLSKYARVYSASSTTGYSYVDYLYVDDNPSGIKPNNPSLTGSWIAVGSSGASSNLVRVYHYDTVEEGQVNIPLPSGMSIVAVQVIYQQSVRNDVNRDFTFDPTTQSITLAEPVEEIGTHFTIILGITDPNDDLDLFQIFAKEEGATFIGTASGKNVQEELDSKLTAGDLDAKSIPYQVLDTEYLRTIKDSLDDFVNLRSYFRTGDLGWGPAFSRAFEVSPHVLVPFGVHTVYESVVVPSNAIIAGLGFGSIVKSPDASNAAGSNLVTVFRGDNANNIVIDNLTVSGGVTEANTSKNYTRTMRFVKCNNVILTRTRVINNADWSTSFEGGSNIIVRDYYQRSYVYADPGISLNGGRDGLHFMDCSNVTAEGLDIESGDDCVGITTTGTDMDNITIRGLRGKSNIASLVIFNEEQDSSGTYYSNTLTNLNIEDVVLKSGGVARNLVRVIGYGSNTVIKKVTIKGIKGTAYNSYGLWVEKASEVRLDDINVASRLAHGIQLNQVSRLTGSACGAYLGENASASFTGVNLANVRNSKFTPMSYDSYGFGVQLNACNDSTFTPDIQECGAGLRAADAGGNLRVVNCNNVNIPEGRATGATTTSYWGYNASGNTNLNIEPAFIFSGATNSALPNSYYFRQPTVDVKIKEDNAGVVTNHILIGASIVRNSIGNYTITFNSAMRSTNFSWQALAYRNGQVLNVRLASAVGTNTLTLQVVDSANAPAYPDHFEFKAFNVVGS